MAEELPTLLLVGCGKMGGALLTGWLAQKVTGRVVVVEPAATSTASFAGRPGVEVVGDVAALDPKLSPDIVVFATKPQMMAAVVPSYRQFAARRPLFLSIAAGTNLSFFEKILGADAPIIRAMPNTPAQVGRGMTVACPNRAVSSAQRGRADALLACVGTVAWIDDESLLDAVTAVSGSGPAYVFLLAECLARAGVEAGLPPDLAATLARTTVAGAGELLHRATETPEILRRNVTSPGGTTEAALRVLMAPNGFQDLLTKAVAAATKRGRELAG